MSKIYKDIGKLRAEYRERVGSTYDKTWQWYAEWLEQELVKSRKQMNSSNDIQNVSICKRCNGDKRVMVGDGEGGLMVTPCNEC